MLGWKVSLSRWAIWIIGDFVSAMEHEINDDVDDLNGWLMTNVQLWKILQYFNDDFDV